MFFVMFVTVSVLADVPPAVLNIETPPAASKFTKQGKLKTERSCQNLASDSQGTSLYVSLSYGPKTSCRRL